MKSDTPGPGTYREVNELNTSGKYVRSGDTNPLVPTWRAPLKKSADERKVVPDSTSTKGPGPGTYNPQENVGNSKYRNLYNVQLYQRERKIELHDKTKLDLPGPCNYTLPSDFGNPQTISMQNLAIPRNVRRKRTRNNATAAAAEGS